VSKSQHCVADFEVAFGMLTWNCTTQGRLNVPFGKLARHIATPASFRWYHMFKPHLLVWVSHESHAHHSKASCLQMS